MSIRDQIRQQVLELYQEFLVLRTQLDQMYDDQNRELQEKANRTEELIQAIEKIRRDIRAIKSDLDDLQDI
jgi:hypothetical protein